MKHWKLYIVIVMVGIVAGGYIANIIQDIITQRDNLIVENKQLTKENNSYSKLLSDQIFQFNRFNQIATTAYRYGIQADAKSQEKIIEYRTILKKEPTCDLLVPQHITDGLLKHTYELRSMYRDPQDIDSTSISTSTTSTLTYCQAVLWIDPLLVAIDKANEQLEIIRKLEDVK
ncbi:hypothetical protein JEP15_04340 [Proteus sp. PR00174]|uniref:hypothetical protein n=1 Tax=Proteus sp. PR00174 TaxID=2794024 RepID=UPI0018E4A647|nr:hypothetical protein [Proteus sp. PR00174]MBI6510592.1 hypothetical protein [Proteus sp. PR00174]